MSKNFKKIFVVLLLLVVSLGLHGCNNNENSGDKKLKIAFVEAGYGKEWLVNLAKAFEAKNPGVKVVLDGNPNMTANAGPKIESGRDLADLYFLLETNWEMWATKGYLEPLDDLYNSEVEEGITVKEKLIDEVVDFGKIGEHFYALPWNDGVTGIVYNAGMFEEKGWEVPKTFEELLELAETIKRTGNGVKPFTWPGQYSAYWNFAVYGWWAQIEGIEGIKEFFKFDSPEVFKQPGKLKSLEAFEILIGDQSNSVNGVNGLIHTQAQMQFANGIAAMIPNGIWIESETKSAMPANFRMKMMPLPYLEGAIEKNINNTMLGDFIVVPKKAQEKELAKEFLRFISSDEMLKQYTKDTGTPRPFKYDPTSIEGLSEFIQSCLDIWKNSKNLYIYSKNPMYFSNDLNIWPKSGVPYGDIYLGDTTAKSFIEEDYQYVVERWDRFRKDNGLAG